MGQVCEHEGTMGELDTDAGTVSCVDCGYTEAADPEDIQRVMDALDAVDALT